ncbi:MAG: hypothetical protein DYG89_33490 [Caldilinea sp. CFX5]|nr:hypothetical protein [Caldilinea sp. CFX5]
MCRQRHLPRLLPSMTLLVSFLIVLALVLLLKLDTTVVAAPLPQTAEQNQGNVALGAAANCLTNGAVPVSDCLTLVNFFTRTQGLQWVNKTNWLAFATPQAPCDWFGVTCTNGRVTALDLPRNNLSGTLPLFLGELGGLQRLRLESNALAGRIPPSFCKLAGQLIDVNLGYNRLWNRHGSVAQCMNAIDADWQTTQTRPVTNLRVTEFFTNALGLRWTPIAYTADGGAYEIAIATTPEGPYTVHGQTSDKSASTYRIDNLTPGVAYYIQVRSYTPAHSNHPTALRSAPADTAGVTIALSGRVLVAAYFPADNDLASEIGYVVERMRLGTARNPNVQVVLLVDGNKAGDTRVLTMRNGQTTLTDAVQERWGVTELDTAKPQVLAWFLQYARTRYPSTRTVAALLGHGIPPAPEVSWEDALQAAAPSIRTGGEIPPLPKEHEYTPSDVTDRSYMSTVDVGKALLAATDNGANPFDLLFFDQCFQGNLDMLYEVHRTAKVFVASPNYAWLTAAYHRYLTAFTPTTTPEEMATFIVNRYQFTLNADHPNTIFWVRGKDIAAISNAVSKLGGALRKATLAGQTNPITAAVQQSKYVDTTQCGDKNLQLGPPDELIGLETFGQNLFNNFGPTDPHGVIDALAELQSAMAGIYKLSRVGSPYLAPAEQWDYKDSITVLAPLRRESRSAVAWRASVYRSDAPFTATWTIDPTQPITVTESLAFTRDGRWDDFLGDWFTNLSPTVGAWCNYIPPPQVTVEESEGLTLTAVLSGAVEAGAVALTWTPSDDTAVIGYRLDQLGPYEVNWLAREVVDIAQTTTSLAGLAPGRYHFRLLGRNEENEAVAQSNEVVIDVPALPTALRLFLPLINR